MVDPSLARRGRVWGPTGGWGGTAREVGDFYSRVAATRAYDLLMRLPPTGWHFLCAYAQSQSLPGLFLAANAAYPVLELVARLLSVLVYASFGILMLFRKAPVGRSVGIWPRAVALLGTTWFGLIAFVPATPLPGPILGLSLALMCCGWGLGLYTVWHLGRSLSIMPEARQLITTGPFRLVRHPLYLLETVAVGGIALQHFFWPTGILFAIGVGFQLLRLRYEERVLTRAFPGYIAYAARTARLIPGLY